MGIANQLRSILLVTATAAFAVTPLASPLLLALAILSAGLLLGQRCIADLLVGEHEATVGDTVFRHFL